MPDTTSLPDALRRLTRPQHERLHQTVDLGVMLSSLERYRCALDAYLQVVSPLEGFLRAAIARLPMLQQLDWENRLCKADWLSADIKTLPLALQSLCPEKADGLRSAMCAFDESPEAVVGCSYVMEGMTLGAKQIYPCVQSRLGLDRDKGARFFAAYEDETGERWQFYRRWAGSLQVDHAPTIRVAQQTFDIFESALSNRPTTVEAAGFDG